MKNEDKKSFAECLYACGEVYGKEITEGLLNLWWSGFEKYDILAVKIAFSAHIFSGAEGSKFMPKPSDIIAIINPSATKKQDGLAVWAKIMEIQKNRHYCGSGFPTPEEKAEFVRVSVAKLGAGAESALRAIDGMWALAMSTGENRQWLEKRFLEHYDAQKTSFEFDNAKKLIVEGGKSIDNGKISKKMIEGSDTMPVGLPRGQNYENK